MGELKVTILDKAAAEVASIAFYIETKGLPATAKKSLTKPFISLKSWVILESSINLVNIYCGESKA
jgi:hypothetical protein